MGAFQSKRYFGPLFFLVPFFITLLWLSSLIPPMQSPDEPSHLVRALSIQNGLFLSRSIESPNLLGASIDASFDDFIRLHESIITQHSQNGNLKYSEAIRTQASTMEWGGQEVLRPAPAMAYYFPTIYVPHFVSLKAGELVGLSISETYFVTRLVTLLFSTLIIWWAFVMYPPPFLILCLLSLPMALFQFASPTIDGITLSLVVLSMSIYSVLDNGRSSKWLEIVLSLSILTIALARLHLFPLIFLIFFLYLKKKDLSTLILFLFCLLSYFFWYLGVMSLNDSVAPAGRSASSAIIEFLKNPGGFLGDLARTVGDPNQAVFLLDSFIGNLGWLDVPLTNYAYAIFYFLLIVVLIVQCTQGQRIKSSERAWLFIVSFIFCSFIAFFGLYVVNTPVESDLIIGMQGRYFHAPVAVLLYLYSPYTSGQETKVRTLKITAFCFLVASTYFTLSAIETRYY